MSFIRKEPFDWSSGKFLCGGQLMLPHHITDTGYEVAVLDPPWSYGNTGARMSGAAANHYALMSTSQIAAMPVADLIAPWAVVFVWTTSSKMADAIDCIRAWGLHYRGVAFEWIKTTRKGLAIGARGIRPSCTKPLTEYVLWASPIERGSPMPVADASVRQTVFLPVYAHSAKPPQVYQRIERLYPKASRLELFARGLRPGWDVWGNQIGGVLRDEC